MTEITKEDVEKIVKSLSILQYVLNSVHSELKALEKKGLMVGKYPYYYGKPADTNDMFLDWSRDYINALKEKYSIKELKPS